MFLAGEVPLPGEYSFLALDDLRRTVPAGPVREAQRQAAEVG